MSDEEIMEKLRRCFSFQISKDFRTAGAVVIKLFPWALILE